MIVFYSAHECLHELIYNDNPREFLHNIKSDVLVNVNFFTLPALRSHLEILEDEIGKDLNIHYNVELNTFKSPAFCNQRHIDYFNSLQNEHTIVQEKSINGKQFDSLIENMMSFNWRDDCHDEYTSPGFVYMEDWYDRMHTYRPDFTLDDFIDIINGKSRFL